MQITRVRWPYPRTPSLGRNLPSPFVDGEIAFDERVKAQFPKGTSEASVVDQLRGQGFSVADASSADGCRAATVTRGILIRTIWSVRWYAGEDKIDDIWGVYGAIGP